MLACEKPVSLGIAAQLIVRKDIVRCNASEREQYQRNDARAIVSSDTMKKNAAGSSLGDSRNSSCVSLRPASKRVLVIERRAPKFGGRPLSYKFHIRDVFYGDLSRYEIRIRRRHVEFVFHHPTSTQRDNGTDAVGIQR